jgi:2-C-methyl-D-erythritol 2,4-cyclodiphosphate synthase
MKIRVGFGYDVHQLTENRELWLGGVQIPHDKGALGHSDADVLLHAICDALLGAAGKRDIGFYFPDTSSEFKNIDSKILLQRTIQVLKDDGWKVGNIDSTLCMERPKIMSFVPEMKKVISSICEIEEEDVSIKATTSEKMGFVGREEGVNAYAVTLIQKV